MSQGDLFYELFLGDIALGPQCQSQCKYKYDHSSADIRIGDLWGKTYQHDQKGVSALIAFTEKGREIVESLKDVTLVEHPFDVVAEGQMKKNAKSKPFSSLVKRHLNKDRSIDTIQFSCLTFVIKVIARIKRIIFR